MEKGERELLTVPRRRSPKNPVYSLAAVFAENLMREVARREWSVNKLAREAGVAAKTIRDTRDLNYTPTLSVVQKLSGALHMDPCDLLRRR